MNNSLSDPAHGMLRRRALHALFWISLVGILWTLDTLTKIQYRERTGVGLDNLRLVIEQATSAIGVLAMVAFVAWWLAHFPLRKGAIVTTISGHVLGSILFSLGHYGVMMGLRRIMLASFDLRSAAPESLWSNLVFEYQKDVKIYIGIVAVITIYRLYLGGENRLRLRPRSKQKILVQTGSGEAILDFGQIDYLESARNYIVVHAGEREYLVRNTMGGLLDLLSDGGFVRTHRSFAVNIDKVDEIRSVESGTVIRVKGGGEIPLSRKYRDNFRAVAGLPSTADK